MPETLGQAEDRRAFETALDMVGWITKPRVAFEMDRPKLWRLYQVAMQRGEEKRGCCDHGRRKEPQGEE